MVTDTQRITRRIVLLSVVLLLAGCEARVTPTPAPVLPGDASDSSVLPDTGHLSVLGTILPAQRVKLSFNVGGSVRVVKAQVGRELRAGAVLAELETTDLELGVQEAEDGLALSQARLRQAQAGPRDQEVAVAEAEYQRALVEHERLLAGARPEEVAAAEADYQAALAWYEEVRSGAGEEELIAAQASLDKAEIALKHAQAAYDLVAWRPDLEASAQAAALQAATVDYEAAKARYELVRNLPTEGDLKETEAQVAHAESQLRLMRAGPTEEEVRASAAAVAIARARLDVAKAGPRAEDVVVSEAQVQQARTVLERAALALSRAQLVAPFDGMVSAVYVSPGEWVGPGEPVVELLDTRQWWVETRNVGELKIGRVEVGQDALVRVMALRGEELRGKVIAISPIAVVQQGDTTYTVTIELEPTDLFLRSGMNVEVEILTG
jgi:HlyD family secretion protein